MAPVKDGRRSSAAPVKDGRRISAAPVKGGLRISAAPVRFLRDQTFIQNLSGIGSR